jgi:hypothetical protein
MIADWNKPWIKRIYWYVEAGGPDFCTSQRAAFRRATRDAITTIVIPKIARIFGELLWRAKLSAVDIAGGCMASKVMMRTISLRTAA